LFFVVRNARAFLRGEVTDFAAVGVAAPADRTLVVTLEHPAAWLPALAATGAWLPVHRPTLLQHGEGRASRWSEPGNLVGNGPYTLAAWQRAQQIELHQNPHYWNRSTVHVPVIRLVMFDNNDAEERAFRAGQIDVTMTVPPARLEHYVKNEPALLRRQPLHETRYLALNTRRGPLADVRVRQALALALDRQALVANVLKGGQQPTADLIPAGLGGLPPNASLPVTADPVAARRLLAEAGFPEGRDFPRLEFSTWTNTPVLEAIQQMWQQNLGITAAITLREGRAHLGALAAGDFDLALMPLIPDYDDPSDAFGEFLSDNPTNYGRWANAGYDREVIEAGRTLEASTRVARYRAAEKILREELPAIPLYLSAQNYLVSSRVQGWQSDRLWTRYYQGITLQDN
jgi:oligopeptide transport system substrate-binding protein